MVGVTLPLAGESHTSLGARFVEGGDRLGVELEVRRGEQILELPRVGGAHNRRGDRLALHDRGERHRDVAGVVLLGGGVECLQDAEALLGEVFFTPKPRRLLPRLASERYLPVRKPAASGQYG